MAATCGASLGLPAASLKRSTASRLTHGTPATGSAPSTRASRSSPIQPDHTSTSRSGRLTHRSSLPLLGVPSSRARSHAGPRATTSTSPASSRRPWSTSTALACTAQCPSGSASAASTSLIPAASILPGRVTRGPLAGCPFDERRVHPWRPRPYLSRGRVPYLLGMNPVSGALTRRVAAAILALSLSAPAVAAGDTVTLDDLFGADRWRLVSVTYAGETIAFAPDAGAEFVVSELGQLAGTAGCNRLVGTAALGTDGQARFHPVASTLMACPEPAMSHERAFVQ